MNNILYNYFFFPNNTFAIAINGFISLIRTLFFLLPFTASIAVDMINIAVSLLIAPGKASLIYEPLEKIAFLVR